MFLKIPFDFRNFDFKILIFKGKNFERKNFDVPEIPQNLRIFAPKLLKLTNFSSFELESLESRFYDGKVSYF